MTATTNTKATAKRLETPEAYANRTARFEAFKARVMKARMERIRARVSADEAQARLAIREKVAEALEREGAVLVRNECGYLVLTNPRTPGEFYFAGEGGSLRVGRTLETSRSMTHAISVILEANDL